MLIPVNEWGSIITSTADGTQPGVGYGTAVTAGTGNSYGSYTSLISGASLTSDAYALEINVNHTYAAGTSRGMLVTIGFDPAGGTSFGGLGGVSGNEISHLWAASAFQYYGGDEPGGGYRFYFPIFVKAGTSIGAKAQTNDAAAGNCYVHAMAFCKPSRPESIRAGSFVRTFGITTASTSATSVTQGTASEGSWTSIGTAADDLWYLETGIGFKSTTQVNEISHTDVGVGDGSNKKVVVRDIYFMTRDSEAGFKHGRSGNFCNIKSGDGLYARSQATAAQSGFAVALYGVGG